jgi:tetratricopeptide (TPR) repeat protein
MQARGAEQANFQAATKALSQMLGIIVTDLPHVRDKNADLIRDKAATAIGAFVDELAGRYRDDPKLPVILAGFLREVAKIRANSYRYADAEAYDRRAIEVLAPGGDGAKLAPIPRDFVTEVRIALAESMLSRGDPVGAGPNAVEARRIVDVSRKAQPANSGALRTEARVLLLLGELAIARGKWGEALPLLAEASSRFDALLAGKDAGPSDAMLAMIAVQDRGVALRGLGRVDESRTALADAGKRAADLLAKNPESIDYRNFSALVRIELARTLALSGKRDEALAKLDDATIFQLKSLAEDRPSILALATNLAYARIIRAEIRNDGGSRRGYERAIAELTAVLNAAPASLPCRALRGGAQVNLARLSLARNDTAEALRLLGEAGADLKAVLDTNPEDPDARAFDAERRSLSERIGTP